MTRYSKRRELAGIEGFKHKEDKEIFYWLNVLHETTIQVSTTKQMTRHLTTKNHSEAKSIFNQLLTYLSQQNDTNAAELLLIIRI